MPFLYKRRYVFEQINLKREHFMRLFFFFPVVKGNEKLNKKKNNKFQEEHIVHYFCESYPRYCDYIS